MDIGPIGGIRTMPAIKERPADPELTAFFAIESAARPDDDSYEGSRQKAAGAEEPEEDGEPEPDEEEPGALELDAAAMPPGRQISFFV